MTKRKHNYPKERKPTGPRPNAGRPPNLSRPKRLTITLEQKHIDWLKTQAPSISEAIRSLVDERIE